MSSAWRRIFPPILFDACHPLGVEFFRPFYLTHVVRLASNFPPILFDACRPLGVEFFRPFYLTHVIRLASNFSAHCIIDPLGDVN
jgi:hypothetical protein